MTRYNLIKNILFQQLEKLRILIYILKDTIAYRI